MASLHPFPQASRPITKKPVPGGVNVEREVLPLQPRRRLSGKRKEGSRDTSPTKTTSPLQTAPQTLLERRERSLSASASVPSLRTAAAASAAASGTQPLTIKLSGLAGARQKAKDVWQRRKGSGSDLNDLTTVAECGLDSPTVPGREQHKRSESATGWRQCAFGAAIVSSVTPPPRLEDLNMLSPMDSNEVPRSISPLALHHTAAPRMDTPPAVPPKTPPQEQQNKSFFLDKSPSIFEVPGPKFMAPAPAPKSPVREAPARPESPTLAEPNMRVVRQNSPVMKKPEPKKTSRPSSPLKEKPVPNVPRSESPILMSSPQIFSRRMESPSGLNIRREKSPISPPRVKMIVIPERQFQDPRKCPRRVPVPNRSRAESAPTSATTEKHKSPKPELRVNTAQTSPVEKGRETRTHKRQQSSTSNVTLPLPTGYRPEHARGQFSPVDIHTLQNEAKVQSQKFEVLRPKDVDILTRELVQLESRCKYLRIQHQNVRAERKAIHNRMLTYLRTTRVFSQENLLKQEEAMASLDEAIEGWEAKVEKAEERRNRVRQKLLEHMAASLAVPADFSPIDRSFTPPATPEKEIEQHTENEIITVYALLADVEQEIGRMTA